MWKFIQVRRNTKSKLFHFCQWLIQIVCTSSQLNTEIKQQWACPGPSTGGCLETPSVGLISDNSVAKSNVDGGAALHRGGVHAFHPAARVRISTLPKNFRSYFERGALRSPIDYEQPTRTQKSQVDNIESGPTLRWKYVELDSVSA